MKCSFLTYFLKPAHTNELTTAEFEPKAFRIQTSLVSQAFVTNMEISP